VKRIICIGNRFFDRDAAGPRTFDHLVRKEFTGDVEIVDGGTAGLNLLGLVDGAERVVFVDAVSGYSPPPGVVVLTPDDMPAPETVYDHAAGLPYLLNVLPHVLDKTPEIFIVGIEGPAEDRLIADAARISLGLASGGNYAVAR
jgi:hydrogenase maturation protease